MNAAAGFTSPADLRRAAREGRLAGETSGMCPGFVQANMAVLPADMADEFEELCALNARALPLLERTAPGVANRLSSAPGADLRTDLPGYHVHRRGRVVAEPVNVSEEWRDDAVAFLLGCSFSAERALQQSGVRLRHLDHGANVPMFITDRQLEPCGRLTGRLVVSMRAVREDDVDRVAEVTARYPVAHGGPVHVGDPAELGIASVDKPDWGPVLDVRAGEVAMFWACGVTPQTVIRASRPPWAITHAPGHMFVTDVRDEEALDLPAADVLSARPGESP